MWYVENSEYAGEGYYYDYPPSEFNNEKEAREYAKRLEDSGCYSVRVYEVKKKAGD